MCEEYCMTVQDIHSEILMSGAMTSRNADGLVHHILRNGQNWVDLECLSDGSCTLLVNINDETHSAEGHNSNEMLQLWRRWCGLT